MPVLFAKQSTPNLDFFVLSTLTRMERMERLQRWDCLYWLVNIDKEVSKVT
jgi:hypothetical protein